MLHDFPTSQQVEEVKAMLVEVRSLVQAAPAPASSTMLTVQQVAAYTNFEVRTVRSWAREGQFGEAGKRVYLKAYEYCGQMRFKQADVDAFGLGIGVLAPSEASKLQPTKKAPAASKSRKKPATLSSAQALKVA